MVALLKERTRLWKAAQGGTVSGVPRTWMDVGDFRYLLRLIPMDKLKAESDWKHTCSLLKAWRDSETDEFAKRVAGLALCRAGVVDAKTIGACAALAGLRTPNVARDLAALTLETLAGNCPPSLVPDLVHWAGSNWEVVSLGAGRSYPIRRAALARLKELGVPLSRKAAASDGPSVDPDGLAKLASRWLNSKDKKKIDGAISILRRLEFPAIRNLKDALVADEATPAEVRTRLKAAR